MDVIKVFKQSFDLLLDDIVPLVVAGFIVSLLTMLTLGILGGPLMAGLVRMVLLRVREDRTPEIGDLFYFDDFVRYVIAFYGLGILMVIGFMLLVLPGIYLATIWFYVFVLMVDRDIEVGAAISQSRALVYRIGLGPHVVLVALLVLISAVLSRLTQGFSSAVTGPFWVACTIVAYQMASAVSPANSEPANPIDPRIEDEE